MLDKETPEPTQTIDSIAKTSERSTSKNSRTGSFDVYLSLPVRLTEPLRFGGIKGLETDEVLLLAAKWGTGPSPLGMGGAPDPLWLVDDIPVRIVGFEPPELVFVAAMPTKPQKAVLWSFVPFHSSEFKGDDHQLSIPEMIEKNTARKQYGIPLGATLVKGPTNPLSQKKLILLARSLMRNPKAHIQRSTDSF